jgi:hypothetical protein
MTPGDTAAEAAAQVQAWVNESPHLIDVLDWHQRLCGACSGLRHCLEWGEILSEYGAGPHGTAVFWPDG